jgi:hypothetical protein
MTIKLPFRPEQSGYSVAHSNPVVSVKLAGGRSRQRADVVGASHVVSTTYFLNYQDYLTFEDFMINQTLRGALPFLADLVIDFPNATQYLCQLVPDSWQTSQVEGFSYRVSMDLEVDPVKFVTNSSYFFVGPTEMRNNSVTFTQFLQVSGLVQIVGAQLNNGVNPPINLDGIYTINNFPTANRVNLISPSVTNSDWLKLASYPSSTTVAFGPISAIAVPA